jgi:hypothetical protein
MRVSASVIAPRDRRIAIFLAVTGLGACLTGLLAFIINIVNNTLPWNPDQTIREHYLAVSESFSQGFFVGFFVCFFMTLIALAIWGGPISRRSD